MKRLKEGARKSLLLTKNSSTRQIISCQRDDDGDCIKGVKATSETCQTLINSRLVLMQPARQQPQFVVQQPSIADHLLDEEVDQLVSNQQQEDNNDVDGQ